MSLEHEFRSINSYGRRKFSVCIHHSNEFGVVFNNDRHVYSWNCNINPEIYPLNTPEQVNLSKFNMNDRQSNFPFIYE